MAESNIGKFDGVYKLLSQHNFALDNDVPVKLKCVKCNNILINPCQGPCLCKFCRNCIDKILTNGIDKCPGDKVECKDGKLSIFLSNYSINFKISKLIVKCPEQMCLHKCELGKMDEHLRSCSQNDAKCPFSGLGCNDDKLTSEKMANHLQSNGYKHSKILIETIETLRNELNESKQNDQTNKQEIQKNRLQIEILTEDARMKDETIVEIKNKIISIKIEKQQMASEINNLKMESENKIANLREEMIKECHDNLGREINKFSKRIDELETWLGRQVDESFEWKIEPLSAKLNKFACNYSAIFYPRTSPYKMQLAMQNKPVRDVVYIWLYIYYNERDVNLKWPFQRNVTIQIANNAKPGASKAITTFCNIPEPDNNSYNYSEPFQFSSSKLSKAGLMQNNYFIIHCSVG